MGGQENAPTAAVKLLTSGTRWLGGTDPSSRDTVPAGTMHASMISNVEVSRTIGSYRPVHDTLEHPDEPPPARTSPRREPGLWGPRGPGHLKHAVRRRFLRVPRLPRPPRPARRISSARRRCTASAAAEAPAAAAAVSPLAAEHGAAARLHGAPYGRTPVLGLRGQMRALTSRADARCTNSRVIRPTRDVPRRSASPRRWRACLWTPPRGSERLREHGGVGDACARRTRSP